MSSGSDKNDSTTIHKPLKERYLKFSDPFNPFHIDIGDNLTVTLVLDLLTTNNFVSWSWAVSCALHAKNKLGFITSSLSKPIDTVHPLLKAWEWCNDLMVSWLQNSLSASVKSSLALVYDSWIICLELQDHFTRMTIVFFNSNATLLVFLKVKILLVFILDI